jgi:hypothetical protein
MGTGDRSRRASASCVAEVWRVVFMIGTKALFDGELRRDALLESNRERLIEEAHRAMDASEAAAARAYARSREPGSAPKANTSDRR